MSTSSSVVRTFTLAPPPRRDARGPQSGSSRPGCTRGKARVTRGRVTDLRRALTTMAAGGELPENVRRHIGASWRRSLDSGLTPEYVDVPYDPDADGDGLLVRVARPVLDQLAADLEGSRVAVLLTDERGQIVDRRASERSLVARLDDIRLAPGYLYAEDVVGTNGMGTALAERGPAAVEGEEHFADALTGVACAGAPITHPSSGRTLGVVDLTSLAGEGSSLMLPLAIRAAREVEQLILDDTRLPERLVIQRFLQERRGAKGPLVFLTERTMLGNAAADRLVEPQDEVLLRDCAKRLASGECGESSTLVLSAGAEVRVRAEPVIERSFLAGTMLVLTPTAPDSASRSRWERGAAAFGWKSLTHTERSVVELVAQGLTNREAAERLFLSHHTVGFHLRSIYRKLGVASRVDLTRLAVEHAAELADGER